MNIAPKEFLSKAEQIFLRPKRQYSWPEIVTGAPVQDQSGSVRSIPAVGQNTFRGFHKLDKGGPGSKETFVGYFLANQNRLLKDLSKVETAESLHRLSNRICSELTEELSNISPDQLRGYNKVRKPVDLYLEHLVSMARELEAHRSTLVPLLSLPLDSWILDHTAIFSEEQLRGLGLARGLSFGDIKTEKTYCALQATALANAQKVGLQLRASFHPIYYDLFWNDRFRNWGFNLFETNPSH
jgi:hypothetical protein